MAEEFSSEVSHDFILPWSFMEFVVVRRSLKHFHPVVQAIGGNVFVV